MTRRAAVASLLAAAALAGCAGGTPSADLFIVERSGSIPGARLTLRVQDGGEVTCNGGPRRTMSSEQLIEARALLRELRGEPDEEDAEPGLVERVPRLAPREGSTLSYRVRTEDGTVAFSDNSKGKPTAYARIEKLTRDLAKGVCGLPR